MGRVVLLRPRNRGSFAQRSGGVIRIIRILTVALCSFRSKAAECGQIGRACADGGRTHCEVVLQNKIGHHAAARKASHEYVLPVHVV
jgi:hypothetical protein